MNFVRENHVLFILPSQNTWHIPDAEMFADEWMNEFNEAKNLDN